MTGRLGAVLFDLDGTLIDSAPDLAGACNEMRVERGLDPLPYERLRRMVAGDDRAAELARAVLYETLVYSAARLGEIADDVVEIDRALRWGFGWERGPFETWDALGVKETAAKMEAAGLKARAERISQAGTGT